ncbi:BnaA09g12870D [Brassica napus]|uniref:Sulfotransferase n=1 Tax=Brassica napus TaxID=3708 RepID=A0A078I9T1_BRANA|nr:BnaA09g12870D [Brassica napus]
MDLKELPSNVGDGNISEEANILISSLPLCTDFQGKKLCNYQGCWYKYNTLQGVLNFQRGFEPQDTDIILASFPKSGTTWLKALTIALMERSKNHSFDHHPLLSDSPHGIFSSLPRLFSTHMPLHAMHETLKGSPCKIVYLCRNVKDTLISLLETTFEEICNGTIYYGPIWEHVLSYWRKSLENPKQSSWIVLLPRKKKILDCLEVNKTKISNKVDRSIFFRKGEVGDWKNYLTPEMENKLDMIIQEKLQGSGLKF